MTKAKMPVIMCPGDTAIQAARIGYWTARHFYDGIKSLGNSGGIAA